MDEARAADPAHDDRTGSAGAGEGHPGLRLGLPESGGGAVAGYGRRLGALFVDWLVALLTVSVVAALAGWRLSPGNLWPVAAFGVETWLLTALFGRTAGKRLLGLRVVRVDGGPVGPLWAFVRTALLLVVVPALLWDRDFRGLHDRAAHTVVVRS